MCCGNSRNKPFTIVPGRSLCQHELEETDMMVAEFER